MTVGQRIFELLDKKGMSQKEFSIRTGIATTTISDWRKKNTSKRGQTMDYVVIPKDTEERWVIDTFGKMGFEDREHLISYMKMMAKE